MRQSKDGQNVLQNTIWDHLAGRRIVLAGIPGESYTRFLENLENLAGQPDFTFEVAEGLEQVTAGDFVLLFAELSGRQDCWSQELELLNFFPMLLNKAPASVLLVSGSGIYGKQYGSERFLCEDEIGYVCHTKQDELALQCLRTSEHFACRFAKEKGLPVKTARLGAWPKNSDSVAGVLDAAMRVLLYGVCGEAYNLPEECISSHAGAADCQDTGTEENRVRYSPLQAVPLCIDAEKAGKLGK